MTYASPDLWGPPPAGLRLGKDQVHVWRVHAPTLAASPGLAEAHLSDAELTRAQRYHFEHDRDRFIAARSALRGILGRYLGIPPKAIVFELGAHGKPYLDPQSVQARLTFNLSHSGDYALIAVGYGREVGVDVERLRPIIDLGGIARRFFSPFEVQALFALDPELHLAAFYRCWTRKEAYIKARGGGLSIPLDQFDVTLAPGAPAALLAARGDPAEAGRWSLHRIPLDEGYQAALAVEGEPARICYWEYKPMLTHADPAG